ncbi:MAG: YitT family protein [Clostridia bacterium]|nr:YitT family protein [Clostridia bacterium]
MTFLSKLRKSVSARYVALVFLAAMSALSFELFVRPNDFAPAGVNGIATMVQYLFDFSVGYMSLLINVPMLVVAALILNHRYAFRTLTFVVVFSVTVVLLQQFDISSIAYHATDGGGAILAAIAGGFFSGLFYSLAIRMGGSTGGTDIVGAFIHHKYPEYDTVGIIFVLNAAVAISSFFVYGLTYQPVILCIVYSFVSSRVSDGILKGTRSAARFDVVTAHGEALGQELMEKLHHGVTVIPAKGMYTGTDCSLLICIVNRRQVVEFEEIVRKYDNTFASVSTANGIIGNFKHIK